MWKGPSGHTERIQTGISAHGYARIVLDVVAVVDEIVDAVKSPEQEQLQQQHQLLLLLLLLLPPPPRLHAKSGIAAIAPVPVAVAFAVGTRWS